MQRSETPLARSLAMAAYIERKAGEEPELVNVDVDKLFADIIGICLGIAKNKENTPSDRIAALDVVRKASMDISSFGPE